VDHIVNVDWLSLSLYNRWAPGNLFKIQV